MGQLNSNPKNIFFLLPIVLFISLEVWVASFWTIICGDVCPLSSIIEQDGTWLAVLNAAKIHLKNSTAKPLSRKIMTRLLKMICRARCQQFHLGTIFLSNWTTPAPSSTIVAAQTWPRLDALIRLHVFARFEPQAGRSMAECQPSEPNKPNWPISGLDPASTERKYAHQICRLLLVTISRKRHCCLV